MEARFGPSYYDVEVVEDRLRCRVQSEIASFEMINPPSDLDDSCDEPIPPPSANSSDSDSYIEDFDEASPSGSMSHATSCPAINYGRETTHSEEWQETSIAKEMSTLLDKVKKLSPASQNRRNFDFSRVRRERKWNEKSYSTESPTKSVADIAGAWMDRSSREPL